MIGGNMLVATRAETEKGAELVTAATEPNGGAELFEGVHTSNPAFWAMMVMVLLDFVVQVGFVQRVMFRPTVERIARR
jgi:hypothetical protein